MSELQSTTKNPKVAIIQHTPVFLNLPASVEKALELTAEAAGQGAGTVVFPETWLPGYPIWLDYAPQAALWDHPPAKALYRILVENSISIGDPFYEELRCAAVQYEVVVVMGAHEKLGGTLYNTIFYFDGPGGQALPHRKLMPTYTERLVWGRGDGSTLATVETDYGVLGGLICWEHWMPLARAAMHHKGEAVHVAQWPAVKELHHLASRHYAFEGGCFVLAAGCAMRRGDVLAGFDTLPDGDAGARDLLDSMPGEPDEWLMPGGSAIIAPDSSYQLGPVYEREGILYGELDLGKIDEARLALDTDGHYSRPDVFKLEVNTRPQDGVRFVE